MGEKGIGRLAIALLGKQVLVLTRARRSNRLSDLSMCFIHWGLFKFPSLNLDDLDFPVVTIPGGSLPSADDVKSLVQENIDQVKLLQDKYSEVDFRVVLENMKDVQIDPEDLADFLEGLSLKDDGMGTHFLITPANEEIRAEIERERQNDTKEFTKCLLGFCNSTFCTDSPPPIQTAFRYWPSDVASEDLIGPGEFFTKHDLECADHYFCGDINEFGQFKGTVRVYEKEYENHVISWDKGAGKETLCGPTKLEFAYLQGNKSETKADPDDFARINKKLDKIGGIYVYRDGIRILPYGNTDFDWVDIETRRNRGLTYYFFSYRRVYGAVCLTKHENGKLQEKAGREGFQKDKAYRQLKEILEHIFVQLAVDFFRKDADFGDYYRERKSELDRLDKARNKREKQVSTKKKKLAEALNLFFQNTSQKLPEGEIDSLRLQNHARMEAAIKMDNPDEAAEELLEAENEANTRLTDIKSSYQIAKPRGVGLSKQLQRDWAAYQREQERLESELFSPFAKEIAESLGKMALEARLYIDQRRRLKKLIDNVAKNSEAEVKAEASMLEKSAAETRRIAIDTARKAIQEFRNVVKKVEIDFAEQGFRGHITSTCRRNQANV